MVQITNTTQLSVFDTTKTIVRSNSTLAAKFESSKILQHEPLHKSTNFCGFPYLWIGIPELDNVEGYLNDIAVEKEFEFEIVMRVEYNAREKVLTYLNNLVRAVESNASSYRALGYEFESIIVTGKPTPVVIDQQQFIESVCTVKLTGEVGI